MSPLTEQDREEFYSHEIAFDNLHAAWARAEVEASIDAIVARHVTGALNEAARRIRREEMESFDGEIAPGEAAQIVESVRDGRPLRASDVAP